MNQQDPYAGMLLEMQNQARKTQLPGCCLGRVMEIGPGRLTIQADGLTLDEEDLLVNPMLLYDAKETIKITFSDEKNKLTLDVNTSVNTWPACSDIELPLRLYDIPGILSGTVEAIITSQRLQVGDQVVLLPDREGQTYFVICKVVNP